MVVAIEPVRVSIHARLATGDLKCPPASLMGETQTRLDALCEAAAVELGKTITKNQAKLQAAYDLTLREITQRLKAEKEAAIGGTTFWRA